ncbi:cell filamentation protein Fic [Actinoplanes sp. ATCC 53533]|uniref:Fic family protein n=1 Tax=Actinoplanes sp. ATCC 53533 TaxID=1288362 RepID=UPI000F7AE588|nr:Fic family protein [Actinoplanes sp. ATCC 53533]RSM58128.1 cell filamentation protein Fic [Actinoplanes sp. ATCC 53533]
MTDDSRKLVRPMDLSWADADPARHPFDPDEAPAVVRGLVPAVPPARSGDREAGRWVRATSHALVQRYGRWACGWAWAPSGGWCCLSHSVTTQGETLALVTAGLIEWRGWLEGVAERFDRFLPLPDLEAEPDAALAAWEIAVAQLVAVTAGQADSDGWQTYVRLVLTWFLSAAGVPEQRHSELISDAIGGRFSSWVLPSSTDIADTAEDFARQVVGERASRLPALDGFPAEELPDTWPDAWPSWRTSNVPAADRRPIRRENKLYADDLSAWRDVRTRVDWHAAAGHTPGPVAADRDGIAEHAARRGPGGRELLATLDLVRAAVAEGGPLTFARLARWQRTVLTVLEAPFRTGEARAKGGRERYSWRPGLPEEFEQCLAEATDDEVPLASRAARLYLDVLFFHPFDDGNARSATLAVYYLLARDGVVLDRAAPLLMTIRRADDAAGAAGLAGLIEMLIRQTAHPAGSRGSE